MNSDVEQIKTKQERSSEYLWEKRREWDQIVQQLSSLQLQYQRQPKHNNVKSKKNDSIFELSSLLSNLNGLAQSLFYSTNNPIGKDESGTCLILVADLVKYYNYEEDPFSKLCQFTVSLFRNMPVGLSAQSFDHLISILINPKPSSLSFHCKLEVLRALTHALLENGSKLGPIAVNLIDYLLPLATYNNADKESQRLAITCLGNLCTKSGNSLKDYYKLIYNVLKKNFEIYASVVFTDISISKLLSNTMRSLQCVIVEAKTVHEEDIKTLITSLKSLLFYGTPIHPVNLAVIPPKKLKHDDDLFLDRVVSSDSDHSDSETMDRYQTWKIRFHGLSCISAIAKSSPKLFYAYWNLFIPSSPSPLGPSIFTCILHDPSNRVKLAAVNTLQSIVDNSKSFLINADDSNKHKSFTSFSNTLAAMIREIHNGLFAGLDSEQSPTFTIQLLKCIAVLAPNVPYEKLNQGLLTGMLSRLFKIMDSSVENTIKSNALLCFSSILASKNSLEISTILQTDNKSSLVPKLLIYYQTKSLREDVLSVLASIASNYSDSISVYWEQLFPVLKVGLSDDDSAVRLQVLKVIENITDKNKDFELWKKLFDTTLLLCIKDSYHAIRATISNILGNIPVTVFDTLTDKREYLVHSLIGLCSDGAPSVRCNAAHTLGVYISFASVITEGNYFSEIMDTFILSMRDSNLSVRAGTSWSLANLCDSLVGNVQLYDRIHSSSFVKLVKTVVKAVKDNDKVRSNAVRALGNFLRTCPPHILEGEIFQSSVEALITTINTGSAKVRWNACYAVGNLFKNEMISERLFKLNYTKLILSNLTVAIRDSKNFKVRINATSALTNVTQRVYWSNQYLACIGTLLESLETIDAKTDFEEFKYKENLQDQLIVTFVHLVELGNSEDLIDIQKLILEKKEFVIKTMERQVLLTDDLQFVERLKGAIKKIE